AGDAFPPQRVVGLARGMGAAPARARRLGGVRVLAVARPEPSAHDRVVFGPPPRLAVPMVGRATYAFSREERRKAPDRQRLLAARVPQGIGLYCRILGEAGPSVPAQLVALARQLGLPRIGPIAAGLQPPPVRGLCGQLP